jgi:alkanesulfonate monooxygenase SsuD/methylene tetrahydromethanopterin reductase-like flavin-dependent oxidoreductase (luciferase family)
MCDAVEGRFLGEDDVAGLVAAVEQAGRDGVDAVFLTDGVLGDAIVLAAGLARSAGDTLVGVRIGLGSAPHRHPTVLAREMTTLDLVSGGRSILAFMAPFSEATAEAITLCKAMWRDGIASSDGPHYPAVGAINRPLPSRPGGPPIALDLTAGPVPPPALLALCDLVLVPADGAAPPEPLPPGLDVCQIHRA